MPDLDVLLFTVDARLARRAIDAGLAGCVVDWEDRRPSAERVLSVDDEPDTGEDLERIANIVGGRVVCRINRVGPQTAHEVEAAVARGATDLLVPMVDSPHDVARVVGLVAGRARVGVMIETVTACNNAAEIAREPADFVYVGLLDLALSRGEGNVFRPLADGTADRLRETFATPRFGIGGVTVVDGGSPVPCRMLLGELARLDTHIAFARRSFKRDTADRDLSVEQDRLRTTWRTLRQRDPASVEDDHRNFVVRFGASLPR